MLHEQELRVKWLGKRPYLPVWRSMQQQGKKMAEDPACAEAVWLCEHHPVYTTGRRGVDNRRSNKPLLAPLHRVDRGGETTFHGSGQVLMYPLLRLQARNLGVRSYVHLLETSCIRLLADYHIDAHRREGFPGVWLSNKKIAAVGVRLRQGISYHGMALNMHVDPKYFEAINPCGLGFSVANMCASSPCDEQLRTCAIAWATHLQRLLESENYSG
ncbi:MAG: lipoyl(octanoyl) transferase LipB [Mariprofundaceae bacterium]|nr:lipoyl(octanoyl) transferase LipB [Mariprofundaceae bacterium]